MSYLIGAFGIFMLFIGLVILMRPEFGKRFFGDWDALKSDVARITVTTIVIATSWSTRPNPLFWAGCVLIVAMIFFGTMARWKPGQNFVQGFLVDSKIGMRMYVICVFFPMSALLILGTFLS